jgi:LPP20 lipoprotein
MKSRVLTNAVVATALALFATGCAQEQSPVAQAPVQIQNKFAGAPSWVLNPSMEGGICAVGIAGVTPAGGSFQTTMAMANGRDELVRQLELKVSNMVKDFTQVTGVGNAATVDKVSSTVSKQVASQTLAGSKRKSTWVAGDGEMYVLMVLDPSSVAKATKDAVTSSYKDDKALWQQFQSKKAQDELAADIDKMVK